MSSSHERPSKPNAKLKPNRKPALKRLDLGITLEAIPSETPSWFEEARHFLVTGGPGLLLSLMLHGLILVSMAYVVIRVQEKSADPLALSWDPPGSPHEKPGRKRKPVVLPLDTELPDDGPPPLNRTVINTTPAETSSTNAVAVPVGVKPVNVSGALGGRGTGGRGRGGGAGDDGGGGGTKDSDGERAITSGLMWLKRQQKSDGHWELHQGYPDAGFSYMKTDTGATALAMLAFLGHGDTHQAGDHKEVVARGLKWLRAIQDPATGDLHDQRQEEGRNPAFYAHSMATIVLCEALALTGDNDLHQPAERAVKYLLESQHPVKGGWKYRVMNRPEMVGDLSVTGWGLMALHTARMAGIEIGQEEFERASLFLDSVQAKGTARYKYEPTSPDRDARAALTAEALLCRQWLGWPKTFPEMAAGVKYVLAEEEPLSWSGGRRNVYGWYYTAQMLHNLGGDDWIRWNTAAREIIIKNQAGGTTTAGKDTRGSWNPNSPPGDSYERTGDGGRLYMTALCILILETPYRHRPLYEP